MLLVGPKIARKMYSYYSLINSRDLTSLKSTFETRGICEGAENTMRKEHSYA